MRCHVVAVALLSLMIPPGCAAILVPDPSTKSPAAQQQDRDACAAAAAWAAQDQAWDPLADLTAIRANREAECLDSLGYVTTTRVYIRRSAEGDETGYAHPDPVRRCFQQAYAWLGRYDGPLDGRADVSWRAAQMAYLTELQITRSHADAPHLVQQAMRRELGALGRADEWQACLQEAMHRKR